MLDEISSTYIQHALYISLPTSSQEQTEDGPHTGSKHVVALSCSYSDDIVVFLTEYIYIYTIHIYTYIYTYIYTHIYIYIIQRI
jgi:hypothetical protein